MISDNIKAKIADFQSALDRIDEDAAARKAQVRAEIKRHKDLLDLLSPEVEKAIEKLGLTLPR